MISDVTGAAGHSTALPNGDVPSPPGVLTDDEAAGIRANWHSVPEKDREFFTAHLRQYDAFRQAVPRAVDVQRENENIRTLESFAEDFEGALKKKSLSPKSIEIAPPELKQEARDRFLVDAFLHNYTGKPEQPVMRELLRDEYARRVFENPKGAGSDSAFATAAKEWAINRRSERRRIAGPEKGEDGPDADADRQSNLFALVTGAALRGETFESALSTWQIASRGKAGMRTDPDSLARYESQGRAFDKNFRAALAQARPVADKVIAGLRQEQEHAGAYGGGQLVEDVQTLPPALRPLAYQLIAGEAAKGEKDGGIQFTKAFGRGMAGLLIGTARTREMEALADAEKALAKVKPGESLDAIYKDLYAGLRGDTGMSTEASLTSAPFRLGGIIERSIMGPTAEADRFFTGEGKVITQSDIDTARARIGKERDALQIGMELEQIGKAALDPLARDKWYQTMVHGFAEGVAPQLALFALTRGMSAPAAGAGWAAKAINLTRGAGAIYPTWGMMTSANAEQLMQQNPGMPMAQAFEIGREAAYMQSALEQVQSIITLGGFKSLGQAWKQGRGSFARVFTTQAALQTAEQNALEGVQDLMPAMVQALHKDAPGVDWERVMHGKEVVPPVNVSAEDGKAVWTVGKERFETEAAAWEYARAHTENDGSGFWSSRWDTFLALAPAVVFGAAYQAGHLRGNHAALSEVAAGLTDVNLHAAGINEDGRKAILAQTDAGKRLAAFSTALETADKATAVEGAARLKRQQDAAEGKISKEMQRAGVTLERAMVDGTPVFRVTSPDGKPTTHANVTDAMEAVTGLLDAEFVKTNKPALEMLAALEARPQSPTAESSTKITAGIQSAADALLSAEQAGDTQLADSMRQRIAVEQAKNPDAPLDWQKMAFAGQSELDVKEGILRAVTRIDAGGSALTALEERAETDAAAWVQSGETTWTDLAAQIQELEKVTGDTYLSGHTGGQDAAQDQTATIEAYSALTRLYATGRGRGGEVGSVARGERAGAQQRLKEAERSGVAGRVMERLRAAWEWFRETMKQTARLNKARREGLIPADLESFLQRSVGISEEAEHARGVEQAAAEIFGEDAGPQGELFPENTSVAETGAVPVGGESTSPGDSAAIPSSLAAETPGGSGAAPGGPGKATGFNLSPTATLDAVAEALGTRMTGPPKQRQEMQEKAQSALADVRESERERSERRAADTAERTAKAAAADQAEADALQATQDAETAEMETRHQQEIAAAETENENAIEELRAAQELEAGGARDENWSTDRQDALSVRHRRAREAAQHRARRSMDRLKARQAKEEKALNVRHDNDADDMRVKHERAAVRRETGAERAEEKATLTRNLRILDAVLAAMPPDVRAKVGGFLQLAKLTTEEAMSKELHRRLDMLDKELETSLQNSLRGEITALLDKASPKRKAGEKPKGHLGAETHRYFDTVADVIALTDTQVEARRAAIAAEYDRLDKAGELTPAAAADLFEQEQLLDQFGNLYGTWHDGKTVGAKSAAHLARSLDMLEEVYDTGRNRWKTQEEARLEEVRGLVRETVAALGGVSKEAIQEKKDKVDKVLSMIAAGRWSSKSFAEVLEGLFGRNHPLAKRWADAVRRGYAQRTNGVVGLMGRWRAALHSATGMKGRKARRAVWDMSHTQTMEIDTAPFTAKDVVVPMETLASILDGSADPDALGLTGAEVQELKDKFEALPPDSRKGNLTLRRVAPGKGEKVKHTEAEGITLSLLWAQPEYRDALARDGYGDEAQAQIEEQLSPAAKALRSFLQKEYKDGYAPLARVFERMFGVSLPQIPNYSPGSFYHTGGAEEARDPFGPLRPDEGGFRASFLKDRKQHSAAPRAADAFSTFFGHASQSYHWQALAEVTRELRGVFSNPDVTRALEGGHGAEAATKVREWLDAIEGNGIRVASSKLSRAIFNMQAHVALAWRLGTLAKQTTAILGAAFRMPAGAYLRGLGKLFSGRLNDTLKTVWKSDLIERRLTAGFTPEVRAVLAGAWNNKPTAANSFLERGMELIGFVDTVFTTGSAAISYDWHYQQARKGGRSEADARRIAENEAADTVSRTAQPVEIPDRSLMELNLGGIGRAIFMFGSEARQKSSLWLNAWARTLTGKADAQDLRTLALSHLVVGPMLQAITSMWRDMRDDDDDDVFDVEHWDPKEFLTAVVTGPLAGIPLIRDVVDGYNGDSGPLSRFGQALTAGGNVFDGPENTEHERAEYYTKRVLQMLEGLPIPNAPSTATAVTAGMVRQVFEIADNMADDDLEAGAKQLNKERAARKEQREEATTDNQERARQEHLRARHEAELRDAATRRE